MNIYGVQQGTRCGYLWRRYHISRAFRVLISIRKFHFAKPESLYSRSYPEFERDPKRKLVNEAICLAVYTQRCYAIHPKTAK